MKCPNCGTDNLVGDKYCRKCGSKLTTANTENEIQKKEPFDFFPKIILIVFLTAILICVSFAFIILYSLMEFGRTYAEMALVMMVVVGVSMIFLIMGIVFKKTKKQFMLINLATALMPLSLALMGLVYYIAFFNSEIPIFRHVFSLVIITLGFLTSIALIINGIIGLKMFELKPKPLKISHLSLSILSFMNFIFALSIVLIRNNPPQRNILTAIIFIVVFCFVTFAMGAASSYFIDRKANKN